MLSIFLTSFLLSVSLLLYPPSKKPFFSPSSSPSFSVALSSFSHLSVFTGKKSEKVFHLFQPLLQMYFFKIFTAQCRSLDTAVYLCVSNRPVCVCVIIYVHIAAFMSCKKRKSSRWPLILVAFSSLLWSKKLKVQAWAPSRQPVKDVQIYKHIGSRDTFRWRVNMLWLCLYNNCAAVRGRRCLIPGWLGIIWSCTVQAATLHHFDTYLNVPSLRNLYLGREVTLCTKWKNVPPKMCPEYMNYPEAQVHSVLLKCV